MSNLSPTRDQLEATIDDILIDYGGRDKNGTYTSGQYGLLVSRLASKFLVMPNPTQPMNEEEFRAKIKKVGSFKYGARHTVMPDSCVDSLLELFMEERNAAVREAHLYAEEITFRYAIQTLKDTGLEFTIENLQRRLDTTLHLQELQSQPNAKEE